MAPMPTHPETVQVWHVVVIRLNHPGDAAARRKVIEAAVTFRLKIPAVQVLYAGKVLPGTRPHQDSNFDVAIIMGFQSQADLAKYIADPVHVKAVEDVLKPLARDYTSYDFTNE
jgi:hypothetical protein